MKSIVFFILFLNLGFAFGQNNNVDYSNVKYENLVKKLKDSSERLEIKLLHPRKSDKINLNKIFIVKKNKNESCPGLKISKNKNILIINAFEKYGLFEKFLYGITRTSFVYNIKTKEERKFSLIKSKLLVELIFTKSARKKDYYILVIDNYKVTKKLLKELKNITGAKKCFNDFKRSLLN